MLTRLTSTWSTSSPRLREKLTRWRSRSAAHGCQRLCFRRLSSCQSSYRSRSIRETQAFLRSSTSMSKRRGMTSGRSQTLSLLSISTCLTKSKIIWLQRNLLQMLRESEIFKRSSTTLSLFSMATSTSGRVCREHLNSGLNTMMTMTMARYSSIWGRSSWSLNHSKLRVHCRFFSRASGIIKSKWGKLFSPSLQSLPLSTHPSAHGGSSISTSLRIRRVLETAS